MQVNISIRHGQLSPATQEKITSKVQKLARFHDRVTAVNVTVDLRDADNPNVELRVSVERTKDLLASDRGAHIIASLDSAIHKLEQQLKRNREKLIDHRHGRRNVAQEASE